MPGSSSQTSPYLWSVGTVAAQILPPNVVEGRYKVIAPKVWQDIYPEKPPQIPNPFPEQVLPYLRLFPQRLHLPEVYGFCTVRGVQVLLLSNGPINEKGQLYPALEQVWSEAPPWRQVYWLWQILNLWDHLAEHGVASSLLVKENLRVEGWRVCLCELFFDHPEFNPQQSESISLKKTSVLPGLQQLGEMWGGWLRTVRSEIYAPLEPIVTELKQENPSLKAIRKALNQVLLVQAARQPLRVQVASATDSGPQASRNEDCHFPKSQDLPSNGAQLQNHLAAYLMMVCDGLGGRDGGEVASQLAVQSLKLQVQALLTEIREDPLLMSPQLVEDQLGAIIRIANNLICSRNDERGKSSQQRMATTLVMALQLPQRILSAQGDGGNGHELYLAHVGDSRAYWLSRNYCQLLTVDDDVMGRDVRLGRCLPLVARSRPDAGALTQALGTREAERLRPTVQRFIIEEDGILLLCSDGLSDNGLIEQSWQEFVPDLLAAKVTIEAVVNDLVKLANERNGHDNISVVAALYRVTTELPMVVNLTTNPTLESMGSSLELELDFAPIPAVNGTKKTETVAVPSKMENVFTEGFGVSQSDLLTEDEPPIHFNPEAIASDFEDFEDTNPVMFEEESSLGPDIHEGVNVSVTPNRWRNFGLILGLFLLLGVATGTVLLLWQEFKPTPQPSTPKMSPTPQPSTPKMSPTPQPSTLKIPSPDEPPSPTTLPTEQPFAPVPSP